MKNYAMFNYDYLFGDHFAQVSDQAKMLYIKMMFYANSGFVANPKSILDSLGYDKGCLQELLNIEEILMIPNRAECFITAYFVHNKNFNVKSWYYTPYREYWNGKIYFKENGVATLKKPKTSDLKGESKKNDKSLVDEIKEPLELDDTLYLKDKDIIRDDDYTTIPNKWDSKDVSKALKLKIKKSNGEELTEIQQKYYDAFVNLTEGV